MFHSSESLINGLDKYLDNINVLPLVETADVVGVGYLALMENDVDGTGVVLDVEPVTHVLALAVDGQRLTMADIIDEQRNQLLGELVGAVVVGAVGDDDGHAVSVMEGADKVVARCLRGRIRRMGIILRGLQEELVAVGQMVLST